VEEAGKTSVQISIYNRCKLY